MDELFNDAPGEPARPAFNPCVLGYVPAPDERFHPEVFLANLAKFPTHYPLLLFSEHPWPNAWPNMVFQQMRGNPNNLRHAANNGKMNGMAIKNIPFFSALWMAKNRSYTHFIFIEEDCRVGKAGWDKVLCDEFIKKSNWPNAICGGTVVVWDPSNAGPNAQAKWLKLVDSNKRKGFPVMVYGRNGADKEGSCVYTNGALGIYSVPEMLKIFPEVLEKGPIYAASTCSAWDMEIGVRLWPIVKEDAYNVILQLNSIHSGYGNGLNTEEQRLEMVRSGKIVAVHQVKSGATI